MIKQQVKAGTADVTFVLDDIEPGGKVSVVGDFNDWTPGVHTLVKRSNGTRSVRVALPEGGAFRFRYLAEDGEWFDDPAAPHRDWQNGLILT